MDRLLGALLTLLFVFYGTGSTCLGLMTTCITGMTTMNYRILFLITQLLTYYFYGFIGMFYVMMCSLSMIGCCAMYWFDMSPEDMKQKINELKDGSPLTDSTSQRYLFDDKVKRLIEYKNNGVELFYKKTGLTADHVTKMRSSYIYVSQLFDKLCDMIYSCMCYVRKVTNDLVGFKTIYYSYDRMCTFMENVENVRAMHMDSYAMQNTLTDTESQTNDKGKLGLFGAMSPNDMEEMELMQKQYQNMTPLQKKEEADKAMDMLKNMFSGFNLDTMMDGMNFDFPKLKTGKVKPSETVSLSA